MSKEFSSIETFLIDCRKKLGVLGLLAGFHGLVKGCLQLDGTDNEKIDRISAICDLVDKYFY